MTNNIKDFVFYMTLALIISAPFAYFFHSNVLGAAIAGMALMLSIQNLNK